MYDLTCLELKQQRLPIFIGGKIVMTSYAYPSCFKRTFRFFQVALKNFYTSQPILDVTLNVSNAPCI